MTMNYVKRCRVCGDEALCFNFNGLSCEACKVFFRRNLSRNKEFECKNENNCLVQMSTRKFCKRCRMDKCFAIGMKKELITIFKESKLQLNTINVNRNLQPYDLLRISEIEKAMQHYPSEHSFPLVGHTTDQLYLANLTEHYARRIIKFCKSIDSFRSLKPCDQLKLMKSFYPEMTAIGMSFIYVEEKDGLRVMNETGKETVFAKLEPSEDMAAKGYASTFRRFAFPLRVVMENDVTIRNLIFTLLLFRPRDDTSCIEFIKYNYYVYCHLLRKYLNFKFKSTGERKFVSLMSVLGGVGDISKVYFNFFTQEFAANELHEIVRELYNLKV